MLTNAVLVVGGAGYIGSHMVLALQAAGYQPIVLDNLTRGHPEAVIGAKLIVGEMADRNLLMNLFATYSFSAVMHFASLIDIAESIREPAKYYQNNVAATLALLEVMLKNKVKRFIFSSSASVYGEPQSVPISEDHPLLPINPYGRAKRMVEEIVMDYAKSDGLNYAILRYFNAAGADPRGRLSERHQPETHLIPCALQVAMGERDALIVNGRDYATADGTCVRDYVHVMDICYAHLLALRALECKKHSHLLCNLGTGCGYSVQQIIAAVERVTQHRVPVRDGIRRAGDPAILVADAGKAKKILNWQPIYADIDVIVQHAWCVHKRNGETEFKPDEEISAPLQ